MVGDKLSDRCIKSPTAEASPLLRLRPIFDFELVFILVLPRTVGTSSFPLLRAASISMVNFAAKFWPHRTNFDRDYAAFFVTPEPAHRTRPRERRRTSTLQAALDAHRTLNRNSVSRVTKNTFDSQ